MAKTTEITAIKHVLRKQTKYNPKPLPRMVHTSLCRYSELDEKLSRVVERTKEVVVDNVDTFNKLKYTDFSIENLKASGAIDNLKEVKLTGDQHTTLKNLEQSLSSIEVQSIDTTIDNPDKTE